MPQRSWTLLGSRNVSDHKIFRLRHDLYRFEPSGIEREFVVLDRPSWVNVVPVTPDGRVVLIRQYRHGIQDVTLEIPGGIIDHDEPPEAAAARELQEETGYVAERVRLFARHASEPRHSEQLVLSVCRRRVSQGGQTQSRSLGKNRRAGMSAERRFRHDPKRQISHAMVIAAFALVGLVQPADDY